MLESCWLKIRWLSTLRKRNASALTPSTEFDPDQPRAPLSGAALVHMSNLTGPTGPFQAPLGPSSLVILTSKFGAAVGRGALDKQYWGPFKFEHHRGKEMTEIAELPERV